MAASTFDLRNVLSIQAKPRKTSAAALSWLLFALSIGLYLHFSAVRHRENSEDRIVPSTAQLLHGIKTAALEPAEEDDPLDAGASLWQRVHHSMLWKDTAASTGRFFIALGLLVPAILLGLHMGSFPYAGAFFQRYTLFFDKIVALSLLPILFIIFGIGDWSKIMLMVIGVAPTLVLDTCQMARAVPREQIVKALTLNCRSTDVAYRIILPQIMPQIINSVRLNLKPLALFLFAGEMIASSDGLAYRIALMRRHMGMDIIIPYLLWVALLLYLVDSSLKLLNRRLHPWL